MVTIAIPAAAELPEVRALMRAYVEEIAVDLCFQGFEQELEALPADYVAPSGILLLARVEGTPAGCVAAHRWSEDACELKRLYVCPEFRGQGVGKALVEFILAWSDATGYARILLDTLSTMTPAIQLYTRLGFEETAPYRPNPLPGPRFFERRRTGV